MRASSSDTSFPMATTNTWMPSSLAKPASAAVCSGLGESRSTKTTPIFLVVTGPRRAAAWFGRKGASPSMTSISSDGRKLLLRMCLSTSEVPIWKACSSSTGAKLESMSSVEEKERRPKPGTERHSLGTRPRRTLPSLMSNSCTRSLMKSRVVLVSSGLAKGGSANTKSAGDSSPHPVYKEKDAIL